MRIQLWTLDRLTKFLDLSQSLRAYFRSSGSRWRDTRLVKFWRLADAIFWILLENVRRNSPDLEIYIPMKVVENISEEYGVARRA